MQKAFMVSNLSFIDLNDRLSVEFMDIIICDGIFLFNFVRQVRLNLMNDEPF
jgi:hypothetical protein